MFYYGSLSEGSAGANARLQGQGANRETTQGAIESSMSTLTTSQELYSEGDNPARMTRAPRITIYGAPDKCWIGPTALNMADKSSVSVSTEGDSSTASRGGRGSGPTPLNTPGSSSSHRSGRSPFGEKSGSFEYNAESGEWIVPSRNLYGSTMFGSRSSIAFSTLLILAGVMLGALLVVVIWTFYYLHLPDSDRHAVAVRFGGGTPTDV